MTKLPATLEEAEMAAVEVEAVAHARRHVRSLKSGEISAQPLELRDSEAAAPWSWFGRGNSRAWVKTRLKADALNPQKASYVCRLARAGWTVADEALREIIVEYKERGEALFTSLAAYEIELIQSAGRPRPGGWDPSEMVLHDLAITSVVADVCRAFGLHPTRSRASRRHRLSGCYIAARALEEEGEAISESAVVKAWTQSSYIFAPGA